MSSPNDPPKLKLEDMAAAVAQADVAAAQLDGAQLVMQALQHELGNQLALTVGYLELLERLAQLPPAQMDWLREARRGAEEAAATIHHLANVRQLIALLNASNNNLAENPEPPRPTALGPSGN
jgi:hypothetical protein